MVYIVRYISASSFNLLGLDHVTIKNVLRMLTSVEKSLIEAALTVDIQTNVQMIFERKTYIHGKIFDRSSIDSGRLKTDRPLIICHWLAPDNFIIRTYKKVLNG